MSDTTIAYIGVVTGIPGTCIAIFSFFRTKAYKKQDLRIRLRIVARDLHNQIEKCEEVLPEAEGSRERTANANHEPTGNTIAWMVQYQKDFSLFTDTKKYAPKRGERFASLSEYQIEDKLVEIESLKTTISEILTKYEKSLVSDKKTSEKILERAIESHKNNP